MLKTMEMLQKSISILAAIIIFPFFTEAQKITYSEPEKDDVRSVDFDIIGKINNNYIIYKQTRNKSALSIYNTEMKLLDKVPMDFLPDKIISSDINPLRRGAERKRRSEMAEAKEKQIWEAR